MFEPVPALVGLAIGAIGAGLLLKGRPSAPWVRVTGTVLDVELTTRRGGIDSRPDTIRYQATLHYAYTFEGTPYRGARCLVHDVTGRANALAAGDGYAAGQKLDVFVDPGRPQHSTLYPREYKVCWIMIAIGLACIGFAFR